MHLCSLVMSFHSYDLPNMLLITQHLVFWMVEHQFVCYSNNSLTEQIPELFKYLFRSALFTFGWQSR